MKKSEADPNHENYPPYGLLNLYDAKLVFILPMFPVLKFMRLKKRKLKC